MTQKAAVVISLVGCFLFAPAVTFAQPPSPETTAAPAIRTRVEPKYTAEALHAGITGKAVVFVKVDSNGKPVQVKSIRWESQQGINSFGLASAAEEAIWQWRFYPRMNWGKAEPFSATVELEFDYHRYPAQVPTRRNYL